VKQNKNAKICFVIYIAGFFFLKFFCYEVIVKQKIYKRSSNYYSGRPCCGPERRSDPSAGQVRAAARRFCCPPHGSPHPSLKKHHQHILFRRGCLAEWGIRCCCGRDGDAVLTCAPCGVAGCLPVADTRRPGNAQDSQGRRRLSSACRAFGHGRLHRRAHASGPA